MLDLLKEVPAVDMPPLPERSEVSSCWYVLTTRLCFLATLGKPELLFVSQRVPGPLEGKKAIMRRVSSMMEQNNGTIPSPRTTNRSMFEALSYFCSVCGRRS